MPVHKTACSLGHTHWHQGTWHIHFFKEYLRYAFEFTYLFARHVNTMSKLTAEDLLLTEYAVQMAYFQRVCRLSLPFPVLKVRQQYESSRIFLTCQLSSTRLGSLTGRRPKNFSCSQKGQSVAADPVGDLLIALRWENSKQHHHTKYYTGSTLSLQYRLNSLGEAKFVVTAQHA